MVARTTTGTTAQQFIDFCLMGSIRGTEQQATGFLAPIMRATGHILFALACINADPAISTEQEIKDEFVAAATHLNATVTVSLGVLSTNAGQQFARWKEHLDLAADQILNWPAADRSRAVLALISETMSFATFLDRELAGIDPSASNPGLAL
jgi:hypothetical protein